MLYPKNKQEALDAALFKNPTSEYRATPFWAWNCELTEDLLLREIEQMKRMGMGGFHMHSRSGMATPYLSDKFMDLVKACVEKARSENMLAWLYDEDRWPSGAAGGLVTRDHAMRSRHLLVTPFSYEDEAPPLEESNHDMGLRTGNGKLIATFDIHLNGDGTLAGYDMRIGPDKPEADIAANRWYVYLEYADDNPWYNNQSYADTLNPAAIRRFIDVTYQRYYDSIGGDFGGIVPAIFTDEPQYTRKQRLGMAFDKKDIVLPWTGDLRDTFKAAHGFDVLEKLPELIWDLPDGKPSQARYFYHDHVAERFAQAFADQCGKWCGEHNLMLTGHMMAEETLQSQTGLIGDAMRSLRSFQLPGIDMLCDRREYATAKQAQSVAHQYGREGVLSELYGVTNWDFDFRGHKLQGDWQAALGVTVRVPHLTWVSMEGEAKRDYPASIGYQSPWYEEYPIIENHFARVNAAMTRGKPRVKVALVHPVESYWLKWGPNQNTALERAEMDNRYEKVIEWLLFGQIDFDFIAESLLPTQCEQGGYPLKVGEMEYDAVIVPWCENIRSSTLDRLEGFQKNGGKLIVMGEAPKYIDAVAGDRGEKLAANAGIIPYDRVSLLKALEPCRDVEIRNMTTGEQADGLLYQLREDGDGKWLFICQGKRPATHDMPMPQAMQVRIKGSYKVTLYNTLTGEIQKYPGDMNNGWTTTHCVLDMHDSVLLRLDNAATTLSASSIGVIKGSNRKIDDKKPRLDAVEIELSEPNALLMDIAEYSLDDGPWNEAEELLRADNACRAQLGWPLRMNAYAQPWVVPKEPITHVFHARFTVNSEIEVTGAKLALEHAAATVIRLNGKTVASNVDGWYVDESIGTVPMPTLPAGKNIIELDVPFGRRDGVEWCYLIGDFGVRVEGASSVITPPVRKLNFGDIVPQGLPFYGGNIRYKLPLTGKGGNILVHAPQYRGALIGVDVDGERKGEIVFSPYHLAIQGVKPDAMTLGLTLFGSRVNSFGAVHNADETVLWHGPDAWRSWGDGWKYEYRLWRLGILSNPEYKEIGEV